MRDTTFLFLDHLGNLLCRKLASCDEGKNKLTFISLNDFLCFFEEHSLNEKQFKEISPRSVVTATPDRFPGLLFSYSTSLPSRVFLGNVAEATSLIWLMTEKRLRDIKGTRATLRWKNDSQITNS